MESIKIALSVKKRARTLAKNLVEKGRTDNRETELPPLWHDAPPLPNSIKQPHQEGAGSRSRQMGERPSHRMDKRLLAPLLYLAHASDVLENAFAPCWVSSTDVAWRVCGSFWTWTLRWSVWRPGPMRCCGQWWLPSPSDPAQNYGSPCSAGTSPFSSMDFWVSAVCTPHCNWLLFPEMVGGLFFCVCMQDSAGREAFLFLFEKVWLPYWHSIPCCHPHCSLLRVSGVLWLSKYHRVLLACTSFGLPQAEFSRMSCPSNVLPAIQTEVTKWPLTHQR